MGTLENERVTNRMPAQQVSTELSWANIITFGVTPEMNTNPVEGVAIREHGYV